MNHFSHRILYLGCAVWLCIGMWGTAWAQHASLSTRVLVEGLKEPHGVAIHPKTGEIYVAERGANRISVIQNGRIVPVIESAWTLNATTLPKWAISEQIPLTAWHSATLTKPGPISISTNGAIYVAEQVPNGRLLEFVPTHETHAAYSTANALPVPWLDQEFQWRDVIVDADDRLYIAGMDEIGSDVIKFGSVLMRDAEGIWWVIDFGPFARFSTLALSGNKDVLLVGDMKKGALSWWATGKRLMLGGIPDSVGRAELSAVSYYPDGTFMVAEQSAPGKALLKRVDPSTGNQETLTDGFQSIGAIAIDRAGGRFLVTDPVAGRVVECRPTPEIPFSEQVLKAILRGVDNIGGVATAAPAFMTSFFERLNNAAQDVMDDNSTHAFNFTLSDIAGKMPVVAGRVRTLLEVEGAEEDPITQIDFFLLFPSKLLMTDKTASPSLSFFSLKRKSGVVEQTMPITKGTAIYRISGTNQTLVSRSSTGLYVPLVTCGMEQRNDGIALNLAFMGMGIFPNYQLLLFQGPRDQSARLIADTTTDLGQPSRQIYEVNFMEEITVEGPMGKKTKEEISNLLVSGFEGSSGGASVGWLSLGDGRTPSMGLVAFEADISGGQFAGVGSDIKTAVEKTRIELNMSQGEGVEEASGEEQVP